MRSQSQKFMYEKVAKTKLSQWSAWHICFVTRPHKVVKTLLLSRLHKLTEFWDFNLIRLNPVALLFFLLPLVQHIVRQLLDQIAQSLSYTFSTLPLSDLFDPIAFLIFSLLTFLFLIYYLHSRLLFFLYSGILSVAVILEVCAKRFVSILLFSPDTLLLYLWTVRERGGVDLLTISQRQKQFVRIQIKCAMFYYLAGGGQVFAARRWLSCTDHLSTSNTEITDMLLDTYLFGPSLMY